MKPPSTQPSVTTIPIRIPTDASFANAMTFQKYRPCLV
jgi:hypothetical protein